MICLYYHYGFLLINIFPIRLHPCQSQLRSWQREAPTIYYFRSYPTSTNDNKPWDGLTASKGYILKRKLGVASKRLLGCACIFSRENNGILGGHRIGRVIKNGPAFHFWYRNVAISSAKSFDWFLPSIRTWATHSASVDFGHKRVCRSSQHWLRLRNEINTLITQKSYVYACGLQYQQSEDYGY